jgi:uncharacterized protein
MTEMTPSFTIDPSSAELEPWPLEAEQIVSGQPEVSGLVLHASPDERVERGIWQHTPGISTDVEADELFVVISGRASIAIEDGSTLEVGPGSVAVLREGDHTTWTVHETLRKIYQTTS